MKKILVAVVMSMFLTNLMAEDAGHHHESDHHESDHHESGHETDTGLTLNDGKKWEIDQVMIKNMLFIHSEFSKTAELVHSHKATQKDYLKLSANIAEASQDILINCKLEEKADENFHIILGELLAVSDNLKEMNKAKEAMETLAHALKIYTEYFNQSF